MYWRVELGKLEVDYMGMVGACIVKCRMFTTVDPMVQKFGSGALAWR